MDTKEELKSAETYPSGPVSAWPRERHEKLMQRVFEEDNSAAASVPGRPPTVGIMAKSLLKTAGQAVRHGKVSSEIREERYAVCKTCPFFNAETKRCNDCGCFMEAKTWVGGDPDMLCPQKKWSR